MGFWKNLSEFLKNQNILNDTKAELDRISQSMETLQHDFYECEDSERYLKSLAGELQYELNDAIRQINTYRDALLAVCPKPSSIEEMKQLYHTIACHLDKSGFELYRTAKRLTGINVCSEFPYEDNRGIFEEMDGHQLLRYLTAAHFHAVEWSVVPGTCHEKTALLTVDTATPEYQEFERELYEGALIRLGFQEILAPGQEAVREALPNHQTEQKRGGAR